MIRARYWLPLLILIVLAVLPALPGVISWGLRQALKRAGLQGSWSAVSGYALSSIEIRDLRLKGAGLTLKAARLDLHYDLLGLLHNQLPLWIDLRSGELKTGWNQVLPSGSQGSSSGPQLLLRQLRLQGLRVELQGSSSFDLPPIRLTLQGQGPSYRYQAQLPGGLLEGVAQHEGTSLDRWSVSLQGPLTALRFWYPDLLGGRFQSRWELTPQGLHGSASIEQGQASVAGIGIDQVRGTLQLTPHLLTAALRGISLEGPVQGTLKVELNAQRYRFTVHAEPTLVGLAHNYGLDLPLTGGGPLELQGWGWSHLHLEGSFSGKGGFLNQPLSYRGTLQLNRNFLLIAKVSGLLPDRTYRATLRLLNGQIGLRVADSRGSQLVGESQGAAFLVRGLLTPPTPFQGPTPVSLALESSRWRLTLGHLIIPGLQANFAGQLSGEAHRLQGSFGPLKVGGSPSNPKLSLNLPLGPGQLIGSAALAPEPRGHLRFDSPNLQLPFAFQLKGGQLRIEGPHLAGTYQGGTLRLAIDRLPLQLGEPLFLSASLHGLPLRGRWQLEGAHLKLRGSVQGLKAQGQGALTTPLGALPLEALATPKQVELKSRALLFKLQEGRLSLTGPLQLGPFAAQFEIRERSGIWGGHGRFLSPWLSASLEGRGHQLWVSTQGDATLKGALWPAPHLNGQLTLPSWGPLQVARLPLHLDRRGIQLGRGWLSFQTNLPFHLLLPARLWGIPLNLEARGNLQGAQLILTSPLGRLAGGGPWSALQLSGLLKLPLAGDAPLQVQIDLPQLRYTLFGQLPKLQGLLALKGEGGQLSYTGRIAQGALQIQGDAEALQLRARAFSLSSFGLPIRLSGTWGSHGGRLEIQSPYGQAVLAGHQLLQGQLAAHGFWGSGAAELSTQGVQGSLQIALPQASGHLSLQGPWSRLQAQGEGAYHLPLLQALPWKLHAQLNSLSWQLDGPLQLKGQGQQLQGSLRWPYQALGSQGLLRGSLKGSFEQLWAGLQTSYRDLPLEAQLNLKEGTPSGTLHFPGGSGTLVGDRLFLTISQVQALASPLGLPLTGSLHGWINLQGQGQGSGWLQLAGQPLEVRYQNERLRLFAPHLHLGVEVEPGPTPLLKGLGNLSGSLRIGAQWTGRLSYQTTGLEASLRVHGEAEHPDLSAQMTSPQGDFSAQGKLFIPALRFSGTLAGHGSWGSAELAVAGLPASYQAQGTLRLLDHTGNLELAGSQRSWHLLWKAPQVQVQGQGTYNQAQLKLMASLPQGDFSAQGKLLIPALRFSGTLAGHGPWGSAELAVTGLPESYQAQGTLQTGAPFPLRGPLALRGSALGWEVFWHPPGLQLQAQGQGAELQQASLAAQGTFPSSLGPLALAGALHYHLEQLQGHLKLTQGPLALRVEGQGNALKLAGSGLGAFLNASLNLRGQLRGTLTLQHTLGPDRLLASAQLTGTLGAPRLLGRGTLFGTQARLPFHFSYGPNLFIQAEAPGILLEAQGSRLRVAIHTDLAPFLGGLPLQLRAEGSGSWSHFELPIELRGDGLSAQGHLSAPQIDLALDGSYRGERFQLSYRKTLQVNFLGPYLLGRASWSSQAPQGLLQVHLPLPGGGLKGSIYLAKGQARLKGTGTWQGTLNLELLRGWADPNLLALQLSFQQPLKAQAIYRIDLAQTSIEGLGRLRTPIGMLQLQGNAQELKLSGTQALGLLEGQLRLNPLQLTWSFQGPLPQGLGRLEVHGETPGRFQGGAQLLGLPLKLEGQGLEGHLSGPGVELQVSLQGLQGKLHNLSLGGFELSGNLGGPWSDLTFALTGHLASFEERFTGTYRASRLQAQLMGPLQGSLGYNQRWYGNLTIPGGKAEVLGTSLPKLQGDWLGLPLALRYPLLNLGGLSLNLPQRRAQGKLEFEGIQILGVGHHLLATDPLLDGQLQAQLDLNRFDLKLQAPGLAQGHLLLHQGLWQGELIAALSPFTLTLRGQGSELSLTGSQAPLSWLPWSTASIEGNLTNGGAWQLTYQGGAQTISATGQGTKGELLAQGPWLQGRLQLTPRPSGQLHVAWPLPGWRPQALLTIKPSLAVDGTLQGPLSGSFQIALGAQGPYGQAHLEAPLAEIPPLHALAPNLQGLLKAQLSYQQGGLIYQLSSLLSNGASSLPLALSGRDSQAQGHLGPLKLQLSLHNDHILGLLHAQAFPLSWPLRARFGAFPERIVWTGAARFNLPLSHPDEARGTWVAEYLKIEQGNSLLAGQAAVELSDQTLKLNALNLKGDGTLTGSGTWGAEGKALTLNFQAANLTPLLELIPSLQPYHPQGRGSLSLQLTPTTLAIGAKNLTLGAGPLQLKAPSLEVQAGSSASAQGSIEILQPFPAQLQLSAQGSLSQLNLEAQGTAQPPLFLHDQPLRISLSYPGWHLEASIPEGQLSGTLAPLSLDLTGNFLISDPSFYIQRAQVAADLHLSDGGGLALGGTLKVLEADLGLAQSQSQVSLPTTGGSSFPLSFQNLKIDAHLLRIQEPLVQALLTGSAYLGGSLASPYLSGEVVPLSGSFRLWNRVFTILPQSDQGASYAQFTPAQGLFPNLQIIATSQVPYQGTLYQIELILKGQYVQNGAHKLLELVPSLSAIDLSDPSQPPLSQVQTYSLLTLGNPNATSIPEDLTRSAIQATFQNFVLGQLEGLLAKTFGLDQVNLTLPPIFGNSSLQDTEFTFGKYLTPNLFLSYQINLAGDQSLSATYQAQQLNVQVSSQLSSNPEPQFSLSYRFTPQLELNVQGQNTSTQTTLSLGLKIDLSP